jgi:hypothetical protein
MKNWEAFMGGFLEFRGGKTGWKKGEKGLEKERKKTAAARCALGAGAFAVHNGLSLKNLRFDYA